VAENAMGDHAAMTENQNPEQKARDSMDSHFCISTIQQLYSILKDKELDEATEEINPAMAKS
jgi:hypothetical protein